VADGIRVYYHQTDNHILREAHSKDGVLWLISDIDGGFGVYPHNYAGVRPSAIVDKNGAVNVFYFDRIPGNLARTLYTAQLAGGQWSYGVVAAVGGMLDATSPLVDANNITHVFYFVGPNLYIAHSTGPGIFQSVALDGFAALGSGVVGVCGAYCGMFPPLSAVEINNSQPVVIYGADYYPNDGSITHAVRSLTWLPW
jgi:hypothetical protein